jgi:hypothetical protein
VIGIAQLQHAFGCRRIKTITTTMRLIIRSSNGPPSRGERRCRVVLQWADQLPLLSKVPPKAASISCGLICRSHRIRCILVTNRDLPSLCRLIPSGGTPLLSRTSFILHHVRRAQGHDDRSCCASFSETTSSRISRRGTSEGLQRNGEWRLVVDSCRLAHQSSEYN